MNYDTTATALTPFLTRMARRYAESTADMLESDSRELCISERQSRWLRLVSTRLRASGHAIVGHVPPGELATLMAKQPTTDTDIELTNLELATILDMFGHFTVAQLRAHAHATQTSPDLANEVTRWANKLEHFGYERISDLTDDRDGAAEGLGDSRG